MSHRHREFATDVVRRLVEAGHVAFWAGGCVRDFAMGRIPKDYDVATDARPEQVRSLFGRSTTVPVGQSFGVILVLGPTRAHGKVEVATFRAEGPYHDGRRPASVSFCGPEQDAARRDFTINGMFFDPLTDRLLDFVGGEQDLGEGIVRAIGNPRDRMGEDKLRMLRAVRFAATLEFELDAQTADAIRDMASEIRIVSWERITQELKRMLVDRHRERAMRLCSELGLLSVVFPEVGPTLAAPTSRHEQTRMADASGSADQQPAARVPPRARDWWHTLHLLGNLTEPSFELGMAALLHTVPTASPPGVRPEDETGTVRSVCRRLRLSNEETDAINWLVQHQRLPVEAQTLSLSALKRLALHPRVGELVELSRRIVEAEGHLAPGIEYLSGYLQRTPSDVLNPPELIDGADLIAIGIRSGPRLGQILRAVREAQLNEQIATRDEALARAVLLRDTPEWAAPTSPGEPD